MFASYLNPTIKTQKVSYINNQLDQFMCETCVVRTISPKHRPGLSVIIRYRPNYCGWDYMCPVVSFDLRCQSAMYTDIHNMLNHTFLGRSVDIMNHTNGS